MFCGRSGYGLLIFVVLLTVSGTNAADTGSYEPEIVPESNLSQSPLVLLPPAEILIPGKYTLDTAVYDINASDGIVIRSDDVFLDGAGSVLRGDGEYGERKTGILVSDRSRSLCNISICNLTVSGFESGILVEGVTNGTIRACIIRENTGAGLVLANSSDWHVEDTELSVNKPKEGSSGGTGFLISGSDSVEVSRVRILSNGRGEGGDGISLSGSSGISIGQSTISGNAKTGITGNMLSSGLVIRENTISSNGGNGISLVSVDGPLIADNHLSDNLMAAIDITSSRQGILTGNSGESGRVGLNLVESEGFSLSSNKFRGNSINIDITGSSPARYVHSIDPSNLADGRPVRYLRDAHGVTIGSSDNPSCVYAVNSSDLTISDLILSKNGAGIFLVNSREVTISRVAALDNAFGIRIGYGSSDVRITSSSAENNLLAGYAVSSSDKITFDSCSAQKNLAGFLLSGSTNIVCTDCHAEKQQGLKKRGPSGFQVSGCNNVSIVNSSSEKNPFDGIYLKDSPGTIISGTDLVLNDIAGIAMNSEDVHLSGNNISLNNAAGVLVYGNSSIIEGNLIIANKGRGILVDAISGGRIWDNVFKNVKNFELSGFRDTTSWNITPESAPAVTNSPLTGGNYWGNPDGTGYSDTCVPDDDGFCSVPYVMGTGDTDYHPLTTREPAGINEKNATFSESSIPDGDVNRNGREELQDVVFLMEIISENRDSAGYDFSGDGRINLQDVVALFTRISG
jgi:parallel beta-helix repeat protein